MKDNTFRFLRFIFFLAIGALGIFSLQVLLGFTFGDFPLSRLFSYDGSDLRNLLNLFNMKLNQAMAVIFIAVGMAVPLTANMYSLKFLEFFIRNPVNAAVLIFVVFANLIGLWATYALVQPGRQLILVFVLTVACLLLIFPYLIYVFRFLHPNTLFHLLEGEVNTCLKGAFRPKGAVENRRRVAETLEHIANIAIRSVDRSDRNTAIDGVLTLERTARDYWGVKEKLHPSWFEADPNFFLGFSSSAVEEMKETRSWVEMKLYYQFFEVMRAASPLMPELTATLAKSLRKLGLSAPSLQQPALREMVLEYFNTFIRLAINRRDVRSLFIIFDQYRNYAEALNGQFPEQVLEIAYYFEYYAQVAREQQMPFVVEAVAHDLGALVQKAWESHVPTRHKLLERFLCFDQQGRPVFAGVKRAQAILASYFLQAGEVGAATSIRQCFQGLDWPWIQALQDDLLRVTRQKYWEVSERRMNIDYVPGFQREKLREFFDHLKQAGA
jgi:hypothetical protein